MNQQNILTLSLAEFKSAMSVFAKAKISDKSALIAYDGKYLSIEIGSKTAVMVAEGEWHGRATVSAQLIRALALNLPVTDPVEIIYQEKKITLAGIQISCDWVLASKQSVRKLTNLTLLDLLAIERTVERHELGKTELGRKCSAALRQKEKSVEGALKQLSIFGVSEDEIRNLIDKNVASIISRSDSV
jgi:hypothetical protein